MEEFEKIVNELRKINLPYGLFDVDIEGKFLRYLGKIKDISCEVVYDDADKKIEVRLEKEFEFGTWEEEDERITKTAIIEQDIKKIYSPLLQYLKNLNFNEFHDIFYSHDAGTGEETGGSVFWSYTQKAKSTKEAGEHLVNIFQILKNITI